jgi:hypothetical protein
MLAARTDLWEAADSPISLEQLEVRAYRLELHRPIAGSIQRDLRGGPANLIRSETVRPVKLRKQPWERDTLF